MVSRILQKGNLFFGFLIGNLCMLSFINLFFYPLPDTRIATAPDVGKTSGGGGGSITTINKLPKSGEYHSCHGLNGTHILLLDTHLEGNLGDELETTPLLKRLHDCGIRITAVLSSWLETPEEQLGYRSARAHGYIDKLEPPLNNYERFHVKNNYDAVLLAPGPWRLCSIAHWWPYNIDIFVAGSILLDDDTGLGCTSEKADFALRQLSPKLVLLREQHSYNKMMTIIEKQKEQQQKTQPKRQQLPPSSSSSHNNAYKSTAVTTTAPPAKIVMSGDLTNSIDLHMPSVDYWKRIYGSLYNTNNSNNNNNKTQNNPILIFSRASNIDKVVKIVDRTIRLTTLEDGIVTIDNNNNKNNNNNDFYKAVFATTSELEDGIMLNDMKHKYYNRFLPLSEATERHFVICQTMEQLFGLIHHAQHVYTDRYHPGVVAHMLGKSFTILEYPEEQSKLIGLVETARSVASAETLKEVHNARAFSELWEMLRSLKEQRRQQKQQQQQ